MKEYIFTLFLIVAATGISVRAHGQTADYLGLPGDNLNLFAVMKLFQESETLESFERKLNDQDMQINNLDLDQDGRIDYIRVVDHVDGNYHTIVLQDALSPRDIQDIAVFTVHSDRRGRVSIQLTGDEALYGRDYIIEPNYADLDNAETPNPGYTEYRTVNGETVIVNRTTTVEVAYWPVIRYIYMPTYIAWNSPWYYNYYPSYWRPWRPHYWHYYYGYHYNWDHYYHGHYRVYHTHRNDYWQNTYYSKRRHYSPVVVNHVNSGSYRKTYSRPEARREGYNMYYKKHPEQSARRSSRPIEDPVVRKSTEQRSTGTATTGQRRTLGESRSRNQGSGNVQTNTNTRTRTNGTSTQTVQPNTRTRTNGTSTQTVQPNTRSRTTGTSTDTRVSNTNQKPRTLGNRSQTQTQTQSQPRSTEKSTGTRVNGADSKSGSGRTPTTTTRTTGKSNRGESTGASRKPAEKKESGSTTTQEKRGERRSTTN